MLKRGAFKYLNRKGTIPLRQSIMHLGMIALAVFVLYLSYKYVKSIEKDTEFHKLFLSRDVALLTNTIYSLPGDVEYVYSFDNLDLSKFKLEFKQLENNGIPIIRVSDESIGKNYPYGKPYQSEFPESIYGADAIKFFKKDAKLTVTKK